MQGSLQDSNGDPKQAEPTLEAAVWAAEAGRHLEVAARSSAELVWVVGHAQDRYEEGFRWAHHAEAVLQALGGNDEIRAVLLTNLATLYMDRGDFDQARENYQRALELREKRLGTDHLFVATVLHNLGGLSGHQSKYGDVRRYEERALAIRRKQLGERHPAVADSLTNLAQALLREGQADEARSRDERALTIYEGTLAPEYPLVARVLAAMESPRVERFRLRATFMPRSCHRFHRPTSRDLSPSAD